MNELKKPRGKGKTRVDYSVGKKEKKRRRKPLVVAKFRYLIGELFFFLPLPPSQVQVGSRGLVFRVDWTKKKGKKALGIFWSRAEPTRVVVHPNTAQPDKKKEAAASSDGHWYPFLTPHFNLLFIITILARSLARSR